MTTTLQYSTIQSPATDLMPPAAWLDLFGAVLRGLAPHYREATAAVRAEIGFDGPDTPGQAGITGQAGVSGRDTFILLQALGAEPEPITPETAGFPYMHRAMRAADLASLAARGWLEAAGETRYTLTPAAAEGMRHYFSAVQVALAEFGRALMGDPAPGWDALFTLDDAARLADHLHRLVDAVAAAPEPPRQRYAQAARLVRPSAAVKRQAEGWPLACIEHDLTELVLFRDDAHEAAWEPFGVSGHAWEAFTFIWRRQRRTLAELSEYFMADRRGHTRETVAQGLTELVDRGWIVQDYAGRFRVTPTGGPVRAAVEAETDRLYFAPWHVLDASAIRETRDLLTWLERALQTL